MILSLSLCRSLPFPPPHSVAHYFFCGLSIYIMNIMNIPFIIKHVLSRSFFSQFFIFCLKISLKLIHRYYISTFHRSWKKMFFLYISCSWLLKKKLKRSHTFRPQHIFCFSVLHNFKMVEKKKHQWAILKKIFFELLKKNSVLLLQWLNGIWNVRQ